MNVGGGLAIKYVKTAKNPPTPTEYIECFNNFRNIDNVELIFEPGRSLVGNSAILIGTVIERVNKHIQNLHEILK